MKSGWILLALLALGTFSARAQVVFVSPDVATEPESSIPFLPSQIAEASATSWTTAFDLPDGASIDAAHKLDRPASWLVSVNPGSTVDGMLDPSGHRIHRIDSGSVSTFFDGGCVSPPLPPQVDIEALSMVEDDGALWIVIDVPLSYGSGLRSPTQVMRFVRSGGAGACDWSFDGVEIDLGLASTTYSPDHARITGLDHDGSGWAVTFDIPVDLAPLAGGSTTVFPGTVAVFDPSNADWSLLRDLSGLGSLGWPVSSRVDAISCEANPGRIPADSGSTQIHLGKQAGNVQIVCPGSCSSGARGYGIYEGSLLVLRAGAYDHEPLACDAVCAGTNVVVPRSDDAYYLMVPLNERGEGSYGLSRSVGATQDERPATADRCADARLLSACPP